MQMGTLIHNNFQNSILRVDTGFVCTSKVYTYNIQQMIKTNNSYAYDDTYRDLGW